MSGTIDRETLGCDPDEQRRAYLAALLPGCRWLTLDADLLACSSRSGHFPDPVACAPSRSFSQGIDNEALRELLDTAEAVLHELGWDTEAARRAMIQEAAALVRPGRNLTFKGREIVLLDAFSANDPQSLDLLWNNWRRDLQDETPWAVLLATRADRPLRTRQFCAWLAGRSDVGMVYLAGSHAPAAERLLHRSGLPVQKVGAGLGWFTTAAKDRPAPGHDRPDMLVGLGNAHGLGLYLRQMAFRGQS